MYPFAHFKGYASLKVNRDEVSSSHAMLLLTDSNAITFFPHAVCVGLMQLERKFESHMVSGVDRLDSAVD